MSNRNFFISAAIFLDLVGFTMVVIDIQTRADGMGAAGWQIGAILASYFAVQFVMNPFWGRLSDVMGRKPAFVTCTLLSAFSLFIYAFAPSLLWLFVSRIVAGLGAANVAIAQASVVDSSDGESRTVALGKLSAAQTTGIICGPVLGGFIGSYMGSEWVGILGGSASLLGAIAVALFAKLAKADELKKKVKFGFRALTRSAPHLLHLILLASIAWFSLSMLEGTFARLLEDVYHLDGKRDFGILCSWEAVIAVIVQAFLLAPITKRFRDRPLLMASYLLQGIGLALTPFVPGFFFLFVVGGLFSFGQSIANPTVNSLISQSVPDEHQGSIFGVVQSGRAVGFAFGPLIGGALFDIHESIPYVIAGFVSLIASVLVHWAVPRTDSSETTSEEPPTE